MKDNKNTESSVKDDFENLLKNINIENTKWVGTKQFIGGSFKEYPDVKNIVSTNFGNCVGFFFYNDEKFLFIHSDLPSLKEVNGIVENFFGLDELPTALCFYHSYNGSINGTESQIKKSGMEKFDFKFIKADSIQHTEAVFDLFLKLGEFKQNGEALNYCLEHYADNHSDYESLQYIYFLDGKQLGDDKNLWESKKYLDQFLENTQNKSPDRFSIGNKASFLIRPLQNISDKFVDDDMIYLGDNFKSFEFSTTKNNQENDIDDLFLKLGVNKEDDYATEEKYKEKLLVKEKINFKPFSKGNSSMESFNKDKIVFKKYEGNVKNHPSSDTVPLISKEFSNSKNNVPSEKR